MIFVPVLIVIVIAIIMTPTSPRGRRSSYRRKSKGLIATMLEGQRRTERKNGSHRGVMCGPGGASPRGGKPRKWI